MQTDALVGIQDMGAAGLTCSTCEMAARGGTGIEIDLDAGAAARDRHDALRDHAVRVAGAHAARRRARAARPRSSEIFEQVGPARGRDRRGDRRRPAARARARRGRRRDSRSRPLTDEAPVYQRPHGAAEPTCAEAQALASTRVAARRIARPTRCCALLGSPDDRQQALGLPAVRPHGRGPTRVSLPGVGRRRSSASREPTSAAGDVASTATAATASSIRRRARSWPSPKRARNVACAGARADRRRPTA